MRWLQPCPRFVGLIQPAIRCLQASTEPTKAGEFPKNCINFNRIHPLTWLYLSIREIVLVLNVNHRSKKPVFHSTRHSLHQNRHTKRRYLTLYLCCWLQFGCTIRALHAVQFWIVCRLTQLWGREAAQVTVCMKQMQSWLKSIGNWWVERAQVDGLKLERPSALLECNVALPNSSSFLRFHCAALNRLVWLLMGNGQELDHRSMITRWEIDGHWMSSLKPKIGFVLMRHCRFKGAAGRRLNRETKTSEDSLLVDPKKQGYGRVNINR